MANGHIFCGKTAVTNVFCGKTPVLAVYNGKKCLYEPESLLAWGFAKENLFWKITQDGVLYVLGDTNMKIDSVIEYPWKAYKDNIVKIIVGNNVQTLSADAFNNYPNLLEIVIGNGVKTIESGALDGNAALKRVDIGTGVSSLPAACFTGSTNISKLILRHRSLVGFEVINDNQLGAVLPAEGCCVYVPSTYLNAYKASENWSCFTDIRTITLQI